MKKWTLIIAMIISSVGGFTQDIPSWKITDLELHIQKQQDAVLIINFWATFCRPCVAEIPYFIKLADRYKSRNVQLLLVSLDLPSYYPAKIAAFAKKHSFTSPIVWLNETDADYFCTKVDSSWSGSIPATLILNTTTGYRKFFEEEIPAATLEKEIEEAIGL